MPHARRDSPRGVGGPILRTPRASCALLAAALCGRASFAQTPAVGAAFLRETSSLCALLDDPLRGALRDAPPEDRVGLHIRGPEPLRAGLSRALASCIEHLGRRVLCLPEEAEPLGLARLAHTELVAGVTLTLSGSTLHTEVRVSELSRDPWQTFLALREPAPRERLSSSYDLPLGAATRVSLGIPLSPRWPGSPLGRPRTVATPFRSVLALAAADLDRDARDELVVILPDRARAARFTGNSLVFLADSAAALSVLGISPAPLRQGLGAIATDPNLGVIFRTSHYNLMGALRVSHNQLEVSPVEALDLYPAPGLGCAALQAHTDSVRSVGPCAPGAASSPVSSPTAAVPVSVTLARPDGSVRIEAWPDASGRVELRLRDATSDRLIRSVIVSDIAPPLVLIDLDEDGDPELLGASASEPGAPDRLRVLTVRSASLQERPGINTPGPIEAIAAGDLDGDGLLEVALSAYDPGRRASTLWVLP